MKITNLIKFIFLAAFSIGLIWSVTIFAFVPKEGGGSPDSQEEQGPEKPSRDKPGSSQRQQPLTQEQTANTAQQDEQAAKNFFKDATYENFLPQEDAEKINEDYLGLKR